MHLEPGGRLFAILPRSACWNRLKGIVTPRLHLGMLGHVYRKVGANVRSSPIVADRADWATNRDGAIDLVEVQRLSPPLMHLRTCPRAATSNPPCETKGRDADRPVQLAALRAAACDTPGGNIAVSEIYASYAPQRIEIAGASLAARKGRCRGRGHAAMLATCSAALTSRKTEARPNPPRGTARPFGKAI